MNFSFTLVISRCENFNIIGVRAKFTERNDRSDGYGIKIFNVQIFFIAKTLQQILRFFAQA